MAATLARRFGVLQAMLGWLIVLICDGMIWSERDRPLAFARPATVHRV